MRSLEDKRGVVIFWRFGSRFVWPPYGFNHTSFATSFSAWTLSQLESSNISGNPY